jgi:hypothetical protein
MSDTPDIVAKLRHELERGDSTIIGNRQVCDRALIEEAATLITSLREALEPFAALATEAGHAPHKLDSVDPSTTEGHGFAHSTDDARFALLVRVGDVRRAHTALNPSRKETPAK